MSELVVVEKSKPVELKPPEKRGVKGNGGKRKNSGRKIGVANRATSERYAMLTAFRERVVRSTFHLMNAQMTLAKGCSYLYKLEKDEKGMVRKPILVKEQSEIEAYLAGERDPDVYHFITTERPDNKAIDSLLDRTYGKSTQSLEISGPEGGPVELINLENALKEWAN